ncbi:Zn-ribbon domain-containing OB-fold protein [Mycolicibacterium sphagni]|uniref:DNA-binding protein n=1 Tax=Mycolicibacterium sphagni TaxID=1786 RepID=A0A255D9S9_9MYCO|nr:Zn-ribbon domain-containing OB-fold protein [Mycolicibacterium sphagni]OYN76179.1 hypothetical protein CG716_22790 [Mycolicibacterium sphagni]
MTVEQVAVGRPLPELHGLTKQFYAALGEGRLDFQRCTTCQRWQFPPREMCPRCTTETLAWEASPQTGVVFTYTVVHRPLHPAFAAVPYVVVGVQFDSGPRLMGRLIGVSVDEVEIGMPIRLATRIDSDGVPQIEFERTSR